MREKIVNVLTKIYGAIIAVSLFAGILPLIPFIIAIIIGGSTAESISVFLYNGYYPYVIVCASVAVVIGLIAMYIAKHDFNVGKKKPLKQTDSVEDKNNEKNN